MKDSENEIILLVDDEYYVLNSLETFLKNETNYKILVASNGKEALEIINTHKIDLVLTDLKMPGICGIALMECVKKKSMDIPVIALTAHASLSSTIEAIRSGFYDYLMKPCLLDMVLFVVRRAIEKKRLTEKAREAERLKHVIEAGITLNQEINNPLSSIIENVELLLHDLPDDKEEIKKMLQTAFENSKKIASTVKKYHKSSDNFNSITLRGNLR